MAGGVGVRSTGGGTPDDDQKPEKKLEKKMEEERVENTKEKVKEKEETQTTATEKSSKGRWRGVGVAQPIVDAAVAIGAAVAKTKRKNTNAAPTPSRRLLLLSQQQQQQPHASTRTATPLRRVAVAAKDTCVPLNPTTPQCGRVIHVKVTDDDRHRGLGAANKRFGADAMSTAAAVVSRTTVGAVGPAEAAAVTTTTVCGLRDRAVADPSAAARVGVDWTSPERRRRARVGITCRRHGCSRWDRHLCRGSDSPGKAVTHVGRRDARGSQGAFPGSSSGRGGYCRPRSGGGGGGGGGGG